MAWRGGRVVECTALEMRHRCKPIGGSNPSLSASKPLIQLEKTYLAKFCGHFRGLAATSVGAGHRESESVALLAMSSAYFSERDFASGFL